MASSSSCERAVVEEAGCDGEIPQRRRPELVPIRRIARDLLEAEILVASGAVEQHVARARAEVRRDLRSADDVLCEVAEHLVRRPATA